MSKRPVITVYTVGMVDVRVVFSPSGMTEEEFDKSCVRCGRVLTHEGDVCLEMALLYGGMKMNNAVLMFSIVGDGQVSRLDWIFSLSMPAGEYRLVKQV